MLYEEYFVHGKLSPYIKKLWTLDNMDSHNPVKGKGVLPNGCFTVAFITGHGLTVTNNGVQFQLNKGIYFCGQITTAVSVDVLPKTKAVMVQLYAWTLSFFTNQNMHIYTDRIVPINETGVHISADQEIYNSYAHICLFLMANFRRSYNIMKTSAFLEACKIILESEGEVSINEISKRVNFSPRYIQKKFRENIGLTPKEFSIIIKLRRAVEGYVYDLSEYSSLTDLALSNNFYDQAHFNNTFRTINKISPLKFHPRNYLLSKKN